MPRIPLVSPATEPSAAPSLAGHVPSIRAGAAALDRGITDGGGVSQQLRRLMNVRVAMIVGCPF